MGPNAHAHEPRLEAHCVDPQRHRARRPPPPPPRVLTAGSARINHANQNNRLPVDGRSRWWRLARTGRRSCSGSVRWNPTPSRLPSAASTRGRSLLRCALDWVVCPLTGWCGHSQGPDGSIVSFAYDPFSDNLCVVSEKHVLGFSSSILSTIMSLLLLFLILCFFSLLWCACMNTQEHDGVVCGRAQGNLACQESAQERHRFRSSPSTPSPSGYHQGQLQGEGASLPPHDTCASGEPTWPGPT